MADFDQWKLYGGYQYTRLDTHVVQDELNLVNFSNHQNLSGWNFGVQEDTLAKWFGVVVPILHTAAVVEQIFSSPVGRGCGSQLITSARHCFRYPKPPSRHRRVCI